MSLHHSYQAFGGRDFVVLCEFSEKDGPVPRELLGTPSHGFPLDQFAVKLMSVEMKMEVGEKWSIWAEWKSQGVEYLVVHFQLHDLDARGYSRQMVFAYVSYSAKKLIKHRDIYLGALNYAAELMMEANKNDWKFALHSRLLHLKFVYLYIKKEQTWQKRRRTATQLDSTTSKSTKAKKERLSKPEAIKWFESKEDLPFPSPKTLEATYVELLKLQRKAGSPIDAHILEKNAFQSSPPKLAPTEDSSPSFDSFYRNKINQSDAEITAEYGALSGSVGLDSQFSSLGAPMEAQLAKNAHKIRIPKNPLRSWYLAWKEDEKMQIEEGEPVAPSLEQLSSVYSLHYKNTLYDKALRSIWQLCPPALTRCLSLLRGLLDGFSHDTVVLDHILNEHKQLLRSPSALLAIGEVPMINFDLDALTSATPSPASLRWLAQSKVNAPISFTGLELGGLESIHAAKTLRKPADQLSFSALPAYLSDLYTTAFSSTSPRGSIFSAIDTEKTPQYAASATSSIFSATQAQTTETMPNLATPHPLTMLAEAASVERMGLHESAAKLFVASGAHNSPASGASYLSPGAPLISELSMAMSNAYVSHRLDYLAADLTSISSLLWPSSTCPSAYFPSPNVIHHQSHTKSTHGANAHAQDANSTPTHDANLALANSDFASFMGLGTAASSAALASGALSLPLSMSPPPTSVQSAATTGMNATQQRYNAGTTTTQTAGDTRHTSTFLPPTSFTSCVACKHAAVDSLLVQLQHDAVCVMSGEEEASHIWSTKWKNLTRMPIPICTHAHNSEGQETEKQFSEESDQSEKAVGKDIGVGAPIVDSLASKLDNINNQEGKDTHSFASQEQVVAASKGDGQSSTSSCSSTSTHASNPKLPVYTSSTSLDPLNPSSTAQTPPIDAKPSGSSTVRSPASQSSSNEPNTRQSSSSTRSSTPSSGTSAPAVQGTVNSASASSTSANRKTGTFSSLWSSSSASSGTTSAATSATAATAAATGKASPAPIPSSLPVSEMNLLHLRNRFSFLRHVIFSLLKGRPVVIHAEARHRPWVEQVISSLSCFVPGHHLSGDSLFQTLTQFEESGETHENAARYVPRTPAAAKIVPWRDARDVIFEAIHQQSVSASSTKCRLKHTKLVITRFLQLHLQKMQSYATSAQQNTPQEETLPAPMCTRAFRQTGIENEGKAQLTNASSTQAQENANEVGKGQTSTKTSTASSSPPLHHLSPSPTNSSSSTLNIPTLSTASRQAIKLSHLAHFKLVGLDKSCPVPKSVERYITYWDWEAEELTCVAYEKGKLLDAMINPKKQWPDEASYRSHIHFHLSDLATRAWMYYHMCCIGLVVGGISGLPSQNSQLHSALSSASAPSYQLPFPTSQLTSSSNPPGTPFGGGFGAPTSPSLSHESRFALNGSSSSIPSMEGNYARNGVSPESGAPVGAFPPAVASASGSTSGLPPVTPKKGTQVPPLKTSPRGPVGDEATLETQNQKLQRSPSASVPSTAAGTTPAQPSNRHQPSNLLVGPSLSHALPFDSAVLSTPSSTAPFPNATANFNSAIPSSPYRATPAPKAPFTRGDSKGSIPSSPVSSSLNGSGTSTSAFNAGNSTNGGPTPADYAFQANLVQQRTKASYFSSLKLAEHDCDIIENLAELIKMQQAQEVRGQGAAFQPFSSLQLDDLLAIALADSHGASNGNAHALSAATLPAPTIKLDFSPLRKFKNMQLS